jgi:hypothetical protein
VDEVLHRVSRETVSFLRLGGVRSKETSETIRSASGGGGGYGSGAASVKSSGTHRSKRSLGTTGSASTSRHNHSYAELRRMQQQKLDGLAEGYDDDEFDDDEKGEDGNERSHGGLESGWSASNGTKETQPLLRK